MSRAVLTEAQFNKLRALMQRGPATVKRRIIAKACSSLPVAKALEQITYEADIEGAFCDAMERDGWRVIKYEQNFSERKRKATGEKGAADRLFIRYRQKNAGDPPCIDANVLWIEVKRSSRKRKDQEHQKAWQQRERERGALVWSAGEDFHPSLGGLALHYLESGLARRRELFLALVPPEGRPHE